MADRIPHALCAITSLSLPLSPCTLGSIISHFLTSLLCVWYHCQCWGWISDCDRPGLCFRKSLCSREIRCGRLVTKSKWFKFRVQRKKMEHVSVQWRHFNEEEQLWTWQRENRPSEEVAYEDSAGKSAPCRGNSVCQGCETSPTCPKKSAKFRMSEKVVHNCRVSFQAINRGQDKKFLKEEDLDFVLNIMETTLCSPFSIRDIKWFDWGICKILLSVNIIITEPAHTECFSSFLFKDFNE